jgi:hypothetical protein
MNPSSTKKREKTVKIQQINQVGDVVTTPFLDDFGNNTQWIILDKIYYENKDMWTVPGTDCRYYFVVARFFPKTKTFSNYHELIHKGYFINGYCTPLDKYKVDIKYNLSEISIS